MVLKQYGRPKKDAYPSVLGEKKVEEQPKPNKQAVLDEAAEQYQRGLDMAENALKVLPKFSSNDNAQHYLKTSALWAGQAFNEVRAAIDKENA